MIQHMLNMLVNDQKLHRRVAPQLLEMRAVVTRINVVRYDIGTTNIIFGYGKDVRLTADECLSMSTLLG